MADFSERDICTKFITPALERAGWDIQAQIREEVTFTAGRINVRGKTISRGEKKRADYILYYKNNFPIALIEAKDASHGVGDGMQQALNYAETLDIPFVFSSNGSGFLMHDRNSSGTTETELSLEDFPGPQELLERYCHARELDDECSGLLLEDYFNDGSGRAPRYYQVNAINRVVEAVGKGKNRIMLVMATGTGKTYTAFQIIWRLWKAKKKKRILFLVDRTALADQTKNSDFRHFGDAVTKIDGPKVDPAYEVYIALYQGLMGGEDTAKFKQFSPDFFDLIIVDECHRGAARDDALWRSVLEYYSSATQIGLTATPKAADDANNFEYFGEPVYTYSLKQGIEDGFLAPYKVIRYITDKEEWRPDSSVRDEEGNPVEDRIYTTADYNKNIVFKARIQLVAEKVVEFMKDTDPMQKAIVFCVDQEHAEAMRQALVNASGDLAKENHRYVVRITGDDQYGKLEIDNFTNPESPYPVIATTSKLLSTGVDTQTVKLIVLDAPMNSMTEFKQIIGRGTRINEQYGKYYFTIMDFRNVTRLFADSEFDGDPVEVYEKQADETFSAKETIEAETVSEAEITKENPQEEVLIDGTEENSKPKKVYIADGVSFDVIHKVVQYIDPKTGKLVTGSLEDYSKHTICGMYATLEDFLNRWNASERKEALLAELAERGIAFDELREALGEKGKDTDVFDVVLHVAYGKKPLTRSERLKKVRESDYFAKYEGEAREIINHLLEKYAEHGITAIDSIGGLKFDPFAKYGGPIEIVDGIFGGREQYLQVIREIERQLYNT